MSVWPISPLQFDSIQKHERMKHFLNDTPENVCSSISMCTKESLHERKNYRCLINRTRLYLSLVVYKEHRIYSNRRRIWDKEVNKGHPLITVPRPWDNQNPSDINSVRLIWKKNNTVVNTILYHFQLSNTRLPRISAAQLRRENLTSPAALIAVNATLKILKKKFQ